MGVLLGDGVNDMLKWTTLASPLGTVNNGASTMAFLMRTGTADADYDGLGYLLSGAAAGTAEVGLSITSLEHQQCDIGINEGTSVLADNTTHICVVRKPSGASRCTYSLFPFGGAWSHVAIVAGGTGGSTTTATMLQLFSWQNSDFGNHHIGLCGVWTGQMSDAQAAELSTNWRTSDWWNHSFGQPKFLAEMNVAGASVVDLAGNASTLDATNPPTLDAAQTLNSWNFNGTGAAASILPDSRHYLQAVNTAANW